MKPVTADQIVSSLEQSESEQGQLAAARAAVVARVVVATGGQQALDPSSPLYQMIERGSSTPRRPGPPVAWAGRPTGYICVDDSDREVEE
jgi:hypothetical protein